MFRYLIIFLCLNGIFGLFGILSVYAADKGIPVISAEEFSEELSRKLDADKSLESGICWKIRNYKITA
ncbi:MAG: hypothetical protein ABUK01_07840 [Leptospirales bacterium]